METKQNKKSEKSKIILYLERKIEFLEAQNSRILENQRILAKNLLISKESNLKEPSEDNFVWLKDEFVKKIEELKEYVDLKTSPTALKQENTQELESFNAYDYKLEKESQKENQITNASSYATSDLNILGETRKDWIKQKIMDVVESLDVDMLGLKSYFVDEKKYCSRATLYRHVKELQKVALISVVVIDNRTLLVKNKSEKNIKI